MIEPYRMVFVNIILSLILFAGVLTYKFIYPKKKINLLILLIIISLLPLFSMLREGTYQSGDLSLHTIRTISYFKVLFTEHILPRWAPEFYAGYGDPCFSLSYTLPYFIASIFHLIGFSFLTSVKLLLAFSFMLSGVFMYIFVKDELGEKAGFSAAIFYLFAPYHLVDMHFRVTVAETLSFVFLPICLYFTKKILLKPTPVLLVLMSISLAMLILSHQVISLTFFPIMLLYAVLVLKQNRMRFKNIAYYLLSVFLGLMLSAFYWLPILLEAQFTQQALNKQFIIFPSILNLLYSPWRYGLLFQGPKGELSYLIGYTQIFVIIFSLYLFFKKGYDKKTKGLFLFFIIITTILIFFILPISKPLWDTLPFLKYFQFSTRLLVPLSLCIAVLAAIAVKTINKTWFFIFLCSITILYTILNWGNRANIPTINDSVLISQNTVFTDATISGLLETSPIWANLNKNIFIKKRTSNIEVLSGDADIKQISRNSTHHEYIIYVRSGSAIIKENTLYFPGWILKINNVQSPLDYQSKDNMGIITFELKDGVNKIELLFVDTPVRAIANFISFITGIILLAYCIKKLFINLFNNAL